MQNYAVIVVGGGITGLVTAYTLHQQGLNSLLLEKDATVGGVMRSEFEQGFLIERGPNSFLESPEINDLITQLNLTDQLVTADPRAPRYIYFQGRLQAVPLSLTAFLTTKLITLSGKLRLLAEPFIAPTTLPEESIASFVQRRLGSQLHDRLVAPFISGVYAGDTAQLSVSACLPTLAEGEKKHRSLFKAGLYSLWTAKYSRAKALPSSATNDTKSQPASGSRKRPCSFYNGMSTLPLALAASLTKHQQLQLSCDIQKIIINTTSPRYQLNLRTQTNENITVTTDHLVLATPALATQQLLQPLLPALANLLPTIEYTSINVVQLAFPRAAIQHPLVGFGFLIPRSERVRLLGSIWNSSLFPNRAPQDWALFTNFIGGAHDPEALNIADTTLVKTVETELQQILATTAPARLIGIQRWPQAIPQYNLGHLERRQQILTMLHAQPGLYLAGNYLQGVSVPDCVSRGKQLALQIKQAINPSH
jgi:protoporphyrinogen/coproporphyrinogen III oxidase